VLLGRLRNVKQILSPGARWRQTRRNRDRYRHRIDRHPRLCRLGDRYRGVAECDPWPPGGSRPGGLFGGRSRWNKHLSKYDGDGAGQGDRGLERLRRRAKRHDRYRELRLRQFVLRRDDLADTADVVLGPVLGRAANRNPQRNGPDRRAEERFVHPGVGRHEPVRGLYRQRLECDVCDRQRQYRRRLRGRGRFQQQHGPRRRQQLLEFEGDGHLSCRR